jgi:hypothetical protein
VTESAHVLPAAAQTDALQAQEALPPVWCGPQGAGVPKARHPLVPRVQVALLPCKHVVCAAVQLSAHVSAHEASGCKPEHTCGEGHDAVDIW